MLSLAVITNFFGPLYDMDAVFAPLTSSASFQSVAQGALGIGVGILLIGTVLALSSAKDHDAKMKVMMKIFVIITFMVISPGIIRNLRSVSYDTQVSLGTAPYQLAHRAFCAALAVPDPADVLGRTQNMLAQASRGATPADGLSRTANWAIDHFGDNVFGTVLATSLQMFSDSTDIVRGAANNLWEIIKSPADLMKLMYDWGMGILRMGMKFFAALLFGVILMIIMLLVGMVAVLMSLVQYFILVMGSALLPIFLGMFAIPGGAWTNVAKNYCIHMYCVSTWNLVWAFGSFLIIALYNFCIEAFCTSFGLPASAISWDATAAQRAQTIQTVYDATHNGAMATTDLVFQGINNAIQGSVIGTVMPVLAGIMLFIVAMYVYVKLPFTYVQLVQQGVDMVGQTLMQAGQGAAGIGAAAAKTAAVVGASVATAGAATVATAGAAAPVAAGGAAAAGAGAGAGAAAGGAGAGAGGVAGGGASAGGGFMGALGRGLSETSMHGSWGSVAGRVLSSLYGGGGGGGASSPAQQAAVQSSMQAAQQVQQQQQQQQQSTNP